MNTITFEKELNEIKVFIAQQVILQKEIMTLKEAAIYSGISRSYLYKLTSSSLIPFYKPNSKLIYFSKDELNKWLLSRRHATIAELTVAFTAKLNAKK